MPKNYVSCDPSASAQQQQQHLDALRDRLRMRDLPHKEKAELMANLEGVRV